MFNPIHSVTPGGKSCQVIYQVTIIVRLIVIHTISHIELLNKSPCDRMGWSYFSFKFNTLSLGLLYNSPQMSQF